MSGVLPSGQHNMMPLGAYAFHVRFSAGLFDKDEQRGATDDNRLAFDRDAIVGGFSQVSGLEASMEPKAIRSGGDNYRVHQRVGSVSFGTVTLKRGLVRSRHLWRWWADFTGADTKKGSEANGLWAGANRPDVSIIMIAHEAEAQVPVLGWRLEAALPIKFRIGDLDAASGELAIEELHMAHQGLHMLLPEELGKVSA